MYKDVQDAHLYRVPKKITHEATLYRCCTCPTCKNVIDEFEQWGDSKVRVRYGYCKYCGQALDWDAEIEMLTQEKQLTKED